VNKSVNFLLVTQFATAFADRAIFFILLVVLAQFKGLESWYTPLLQLAFILAYVLFAPWAGSFSDRRPKRNVLVIGNIVKMVGLGILFLHLIPALREGAILIGYFIIGFGAVMFSPAKYGLLPELVDKKKLVKVNAWLEGGTIVAILSGQLAGALLGEINVVMALSIAVIIYAVSTLLAFGVKLTQVKQKPKIHFFKNFVADFRALLQHHVVRFALLGVSLFWSVAAILQVLVLEWAKTAINMTQVSETSVLGIFIGIGIVLGSIVVPFFINLKNLRRVRFAAYGMGVFVIVLSQLTSLYPIFAVLILIGISGGILVVPINAALEEIGHQTVGSGGAVAVQRFSENLSMLTSLIIYTLILAWGVPAELIMLAMGIIVLVLTTLIGLNLPKKGNSFFERENNETT